MDKKITIYLPPTLLEKLEIELKKSPFTGLDELLTLIIQQHFDQKERSIRQNRQTDDEAIRKRLEGLGYL